MSITKQVFLYIGFWLTEVKVELQY